jgi:hypothetical protein
MNDLQQVKIFIKQSEEFKTSEMYKTMPNDQRDFFNEELGRFKLLVELNDSSQAVEKINSEN